MTVRLLFVCLGNICSSPTAEGVMRALVREAACRTRSSSTRPARAPGTSAAPRRARTAAAASAGDRARGLARVRSAQRTSRTSICCSRWTARTCASCERLAPATQERAKVRLLREFDPASASAGDLDVPDPYYGAHGWLRGGARPRAGGLRGPARARSAPASPVVSLPAGASVRGASAGATSTRPSTSCSRTAARRS